MRFHVVSLPHTITSKKYSWCAYTQKVLNFCKMMTARGHEVFHYGTEGAEVSASHVSILSAAERERFFGDPDANELPSPTFDPTVRFWKIVNARAAGEILSRLQPRDYLCLIGGLAQKPIADLIGEGESMTVEYGIGYTGIFARYKVFESYTHQALVYGRTAADPDGFAYDAVIPNYFDPEDFPEPDAERGDHLIYLARVMERKGIRTAVAVANASGRKLVVAGQMPKDGSSDWIKDEPLVEYVGLVEPAARAAMLSKAAALVQPTTYIEPFGGCVVEAALCGTPSITTDYGAFAETIQHGETGYRCHTLEQFTWSVNNLDKLASRSSIRERALKNYSLARVGGMYEEYFSMLYDLWDAGWPTPRPDRKDLCWLRKTY